MAMCSVGHAEVRPCIRPMHHHSSSMSISTAVIISVAGQEQVRGMVYYQNGHSIQAATHICVAARYQARGAALRAPLHARSAPSRTAHAYVHARPRVGMRAHARVLDSARRAPVPACAQRMLHATHICVCVCPLPLVNRVGALVLTPTLLLMMT